MLKNKVEIINDISGLDNFIDINFYDILKMDECSGVIEDLIFLVGYNYIEVKDVSSNSIYFYAGMFSGDMDEKLSIRDGKIDGKLLMAVETTFNVLKDVKNQSNILDLYPREMRKSINDDILKRNKIEPFFLKQLSSRLL